MSRSFDVRKNSLFTACVFVLGTLYWKWRLIVSYYPFLNGATAPSLRGTSATLLLQLDFVSADVQGVSIAEAGCKKRRNSMTLGPLEYLVVGFEGNRFSGQILHELRAARDEGIIRVVDMIVFK